MKVTNDHRSKFSNLSNWKEEAWKKSGLLPSFSNLGGTAPKKSIWAPLHISTHDNSNLNSTREIEKSSSYREFEANNRKHDKQIGGEGMQLGNKADFIYKNGHWIELEWQKSKGKELTRLSLYIFKISEFSARLFIPTFHAPITWFELSRVEGKQKLLRVSERFELSLRPLSYQR